MKNATYGLLAVFALVLASMLVPFPPTKLVEAEVARTGYQTLRAVPALVISAITATDTNTVSADTPIRPRYTKGNPKIALSSSHSVASATSIVLVNLYHRDADGVYTFLGCSDAITLTGSASKLVSSRYVSEDIYEIDTRGANVFDLHISTISSGDVSVRAWCYGVESGTATPAD